MLRRMTAATLMLGLVAMAASAGAPDKEEIKKAANAFATALAGGDAAAAKAACIGAEAETALVEDMIGLMNAVKKLRKAGGDKFGDAGASLAPEQRGPGEDLARELNAADVKIDGENATITSKSDKEEILKLKRVDGKWKIDLGAMPNKEEMLKAGPVIRTMAKAANDTAAEIAAGKFKTADEAKAALAKMFPALVGAAGPTSKPAK
jgi:hypothetical protein